MQCRSVHKKRDGNWTNEKQAQQLERCIPLFKKVHPDCDLLFAFDNSQNHHARAPDALVASRVNLNDGGKNAPIMRDTRFKSVKEDGSIEDIEQKMYIEKDGTKIPKGARTILQERGLWSSIAGRKVLRCHDCAEGKSPEGAIYCCAIRCLSHQEDFKNSKEWLQEIAEKHGCSLIFFPKFHCELNFIEMIWAYLKNRLRRQCTYTFKELFDNVGQELLNIPLDFIRKVERRCFRYMDGYRLDLQGPLLDFAVRKYKSHRRIPTKEIDSIRKAFEVFREKKLKTDGRFSSPISVNVIDAIMVE